jgi:hypothetical protein
VCGQHHAPAAFTPGKDVVPIVQEAGWVPEPAWIGAENLAQPGFDPQTFQPVASRYTDYAIPAPTYYITYINFERGLQCNSMTSLWLTIYNEVNFMLIFFSQQLLQEQNTVLNYGYLYINNLQLFK